MQMSTLLSAVPRDAECSESRLFQAQEPKDDNSNGLKTLDNETILDEPFSFQIRHFVSTVRQQDFSKCWPFRQKILEKCLSVGLKPFLPPFEPLLKSTDNEEVEHGLLFSKLQQVSSLREDKDLCEESDGQDFSNCHKSSVGEQAGSCAITTSILDKETNEDGSTGLQPAKPCAGQLVQEVGNPGSEKSEDYSNDEFETLAKVRLNDRDPSDSGNEAGHCENSKASMSLQVENIASSGVKHSDFHGSSHNEGEAGSALVTGLSVSVSKSCLSKKIQQHHKGKYKLLSSECPVTEEQVGYNRSKLSRLGTAGKEHQDEAQLSSERLAVLDNATDSCIERDTVELPARLERHCRNADDSSCTGLNLDTLVPQVCPVCLNFTSTSNTALNAHIDHCLESVLPGEKGESRVNKHRIKPRKMRSMIDICATAPTRTLEDLERSSKIWALKVEASKEESSCSPSWNNGLVRRQPRTSVHRGPGWKARSTLETDDTRQFSGFDMQVQVEKPQEEGLTIAEQLEIRGWTHETAAAHQSQQSCEDRQLHHEEPSGTTYAASAVNVGQGTSAKRKKKRGSTGVISIKEVIMSEECGHSNKEDDDQSWSVPYDLSGFTTIDTSAEEERRLLQNFRCPNGGETEAGKLLEEAFAEDVGNKSATIYKHFFPNGPSSSDFTSKKCENKSSNEASKKRLRTSIESDWILGNSEMSGEEDEVLLQLPFERPNKSKKAAPKIKSLLTVVANSCKEKGKDETEGSIYNQNTNEVQDKRAVNTAANGASSSCQETRFKRKSLTSVQDVKEGYCELSKRARSCSEQLTSPEDLHVYSLSEQGKSPKQGSASSIRPLVEQEEPYTNCPQQDIPECLIEGFADVNLPGEGLGSLTSLLSARQPEKKNFIQAFEKTNITIAVASTADILVKAPLSRTDMSGMSETEVSFCRNRHESLRKASTNAPMEACFDGEEIFRKTPNGSEQTSKSHLSMSRRFTVSDSGSSANLFATFGKVNSIETDLRHIPHMLPANQTSFSSDIVTCSRPIDHLRAKQPLYESLAASNCSVPISRDHKSSHANIGPRWYNNPQFLASGRKDVKDNGQPQPTAEGSENLDQCMLRCSVKHGASQVSFRVGDSYDRSCLNPSDSPVNRDVHILDNSNNFVANKTDHIQVHSGLMEAAHCTVSAAAPHHHQQIYLGSRISSSDLSSRILSAASEALQENGNIGSCASNGYDYGTVSAISTERMSPSSNLLADIARTMATDCRKHQEPLRRSNVLSGEQQQTLQVSQQSTAKNPRKGHEYLNLLPSQGTGKSCAPSASNGTVQPHVLQTAVQALKANTSMINSERVNGMRGSVDVSRNVRSTLPSISTFRRDHSSACLNGTRETFLGAELASNFGNFGTVEYPVDQGVVHIFGSPVFKLMGQNVIVTSNSINAVGSCDQNGIQRFHSSGSIRHLGVLPETQHPYVHNMSPELYPSSQLEAWHGDACMPRSHSFMMDNLEIHPQALQHAAPTKSVHSKMPAYKDPVILKPQMPVRILDEGSKNARLTRELAVKKLAVANPGNKIAAESYIDTMPGVSSSLPSGLSRGNGMIAQPNGRHFVSSNCTLPQHEQQSRAFTLQSTSATYLEDIQNLDGSGCSTQYRSGTLADIVQSSDRGNS